MPKDNLKLYINKSVSPHQGLSIDDLGLLFGLASRDLGYIITHAPINIWAKYKPTDITDQYGDTWGLLTSAQRQAVRYGLTAPVGTTTLEQLKSHYDDDDDYVGDVKMNGWSYTLPTRFRMMDFIDGDSFARLSTGIVKGYDHGAVPPISVVGAPSTGIRNTIQNGQLSIVCKWTPDSSGLSVKLADLGFGNYYFGVALVMGEAVDGYQAGTYILATSTSTIAQAQQDQSNLQLGITAVLYPYQLPVSSKYRLYPFLTSTKVTTGTVLQAGVIGGRSTAPTSATMPANYYPIPGAEVSIVNITGAGLLVELFAFRITSSGNAITVQLRLTNQTSGSITTTSPIYIYLMPSGRTPTSAYDSSLDERFSFAGVTLAASGQTGSTVTLEHTFYITGNKVSTIYSASAHAQAWAVVGQNSASTYSANITGRYTPVINPEELVEEP